MVEAKDSAKDQPQWLKPLGMETMMVDQGYNKGKWLSLHHHRPARVRKEAVVTGFCVLGKLG